MRTDIDTSRGGIAAARLVRKQVVATATATSDSDEIEIISINEDLPGVTETFPDSENFMTLTSLPGSDDDHENTATGTASDTYIPPIVTSAKSEDFLSLTTTNAGAGAVPIASESVISRITVSNADPAAAPATLEVVATVMTVVSEGVTAVVSTATTVPAASAPTPSTIKSSQVQLSASFGKIQYALATYLGVVLAVVLKLTWSLTFSGLKMMEPFHQLSKAGGATAQESLTSDFLSASYGKSHLRHILSGHWAMLFGTITCVVAGTLSPLSSELMSVVSTQLCPTSSGRAQACAPVWVINTSAARLVEAVLLLTAILILLVSFFNFRRKSGVFSNPSSIATLASLLSHDSIRHDLGGVNQSSPDKDILAALEGSRYALTSAPDATGRLQYGLVNTRMSQRRSPQPLEAQGLLPEKDLLTPTHSIDQYLTSPPKQAGAFPQWKRMLRDAFFGGLILALFGTVLAYYLIGGDGTFNNFFNSKSFGPRFFLTTAASSSTLRGRRWNERSASWRLIATWEPQGAPPPKRASSSTLAACRLRVFGAPSDAVITSTLRWQPLQSSPTY